MLISLCRFDEAKQLLDECLILSRKAGMRTYEGYALLTQGAWHLYRGEPIPAIDTLQQALEILETMRNHDLTGVAKAFIGHAFYHLAELDCGRKWLEDGLALSQTIGQQNRVALTLNQLAVLEIAAKRLTVARDELAMALAIARSVGSKQLVLISLIATARLERLSGASALAKEYALEALRSLPGLNLPDLELWAGVETGLALADLGELEAALVHTRNAKQLIPRAHQLWIGFEQAYLAHARVLRLSGDLDEAYDHECLAIAFYQPKVAQIPDLIRRKQFQMAFERDISSLARPISTTD
jgi:tetratricopeptide (TPR) repeat protein